MHDKFNYVAKKISNATGSPIALLIAIGTIVVWFIYGLAVGFTDTVQLYANTGTTLVTFILVFVIQASQNRDSKALHLKIDELIRAIDPARNTLISAETSTEAELAETAEEFAEIAKEAADEAEHVAEKVDQSTVDIEKHPE